MQQTILSIPVTKVQTNSELWTGGITAGLIKPKFRIGRKTPKKHGGFQSVEQWKNWLRGC